MPRKGQKQNEATRQAALKNIAIAVKRKQFSKEMRQGRLQNLLKINHINLFKHNTNQVRRLASDLSVAMSTVWKDLRFLINQELQYEQTRLENKENLQKNNQNQALDGNSPRESGLSTSATTQHTYSMGKNAGFRPWHRGKFTNNTHFRRFEGRKLSNYTEKSEWNPNISSDFISQATAMNPFVPPAKMYFNKLTGQYYDSYEDAARGEHE